MRSRSLSDIVYGPDLIDYSALNVREAHVAAVVMVRKLFVVEAHEVRDGRVEIVKALAVLDGLGSEVIGRPDDCTPLDNDKVS